MDKVDKFWFRPSISDHDRIIIDSIIQAEGKKYNIRGYGDWINLKIRKLCVYHAIPYTAIHRQPHTLSNFPIRVYNKQIGEMGDRNVIDALSEFARIKRFTITQVIQKYILDPYILESELKEVSGKK